MKNKRIPVDIAMEPLFMIFTLEREDEDIEVEGYYYPGEDDDRTGHPDSWTEGIGHEFEVVSSEGPNGYVELTDDELDKLLDMAFLQYQEEAE